MNNLNCQERLAELIRRTEDVRYKLPIDRIDDIIKLNKSLRKLYRDFWRHQADDMFYKMDKLEEELREERKKNEQRGEKDENNTV